MHQRCRRTINSSTTHKPSAQRLVTAQQHGIDPRADAPPQPPSTRTWFGAALPDASRAATADAATLLQRIATLCRLAPSRMQHVLLLQCCDALEASGRLHAGEVAKLRALLRKVHTLTTVLAPGWTQVRCVSLPSFSWLVCVWWHVQSHVWIWSMVG